MATASFNRHEQHTSTDPTITAPSSADGGTNNTANNTSDPDTRLSAISTVDYGDSLTEMTHYETGGTGTTITAPSSADGGQSGTNEIDNTAPSSDQNSDSMTNSPVRHNAVVRGARDDENRSNESLASDVHTSNDGDDDGYPGRKRKPDAEIDGGQSGTNEIIDGENCEDLLQNDDAEAMGAAIKEAQGVIDILNGDRRTLSAAEQTDEVFSRYQSMMETDGGVNGVCVGDSAGEIDEKLGLDAAAKVMEAEVDNVVADTLPTAENLQEVTKTNKFVPRERDPTERQPFHRSESSRFRNTVEHVVVPVIKLKTRTEHAPRFALHAHKII